MAVSSICAACLICHVFSTLHCAGSAAACGLTFIPTRGAECYSSCGWSDHFVVTVARAAAPEVDGRPVGPFNVTEADMEEIIRIGHELDLTLGM